MQPFYEHHVLPDAMETLSWSGPAWDRIRLTALDEELDEYRLLAYLQRVDAHYREHKLYPYLDELHLRIGQLTELRKRTEALEAGIVGDLTGLDLRRMELLRKPVDRPQLQEVRLSIGRALRELRRSMEKGSELREELNEGIHYAPIGVLPLGTREGWLLLRQGNKAWAYSYAIPLVHGGTASAGHARMRTHFCTSWTLGIGRSYEQIKAELIRLGPLPNPATFVFESDATLPRIETFMPLAKQLVYEFIAGTAA
jgi:hypothetical protein